MIAAALAKCANQTEHVFVANCSAVKRIVIDYGDLR